MSAELPLPEGFAEDDKQQIFWAYLVEGIVDSSLWQLGTKDERLLFITLLAKKKKNGCVYYKSLPGLMRWAHLTMKETKDALEGLQKPDPHSGSKVLEGRRIVPIDGMPITSACQLVNAKYYQGLIQAQMRKDYQAEWQKGYRQKHKALTQTLTNVDTALTPRRDIQIQIHNTNQKRLNEYPGRQPDKRSGEFQLQEDTVKRQAIENDLIERARTLIGLPAMEKDGGLIRQTIRTNPTKADRVLCEIQRMITEHVEIRSPIGNFLDLWKRFQ